MVKNGKLEPADDWRLSSLLNKALFDLNRRFLLGWSVRRASV